MIFRLLLLIGIVASGSAQAAIGTCESLRKVLDNSPLHKDRGFPEQPHIFVDEIFFRDTLKKLKIPRPSSDRQFIEKFKPWGCTAYNVGHVLNIVDMLVDGKRISKVYYRELALTPGGGAEPEPWGALQIDGRVYVEGGEECRNERPIFQCDNVVR